MVTLKVGPASKCFFVHKAILTENPFFARCLDVNRFQEGVDNLIKMPEDDPQAMAYVIRFLYTGSLIARDVRDRGHLNYDESISGLISLFAIADKYLIEEMCEEVLGFALSLLLSQNGPTWGDLEEVKASGLRDTSLWDMFEDVIVDLATTRPKDGILTKLLNDGLETDGQAAVALLYKLETTLAK